MVQSQSYILQTLREPNAAGAKESTLNPKPETMLVAVRAQFTLFGRL